MPRLDTVIRTLADRTRLRLLNLLGGDEVCVCFLVEILRQAQPNVSRHLAHLRKAGIVEARREGKWMHYRIAQPKNEQLSKILADVRSWLETDPEMKRERMQLRRMSCSSRLPAQLKNAPKPTVLVNIAGESV